MGNDHKANWSEDPRTDKSSTRSGELWRNMKFVPTIPLDVWEFIQEYEGRNKRSKSDIKLCIYNNTIDSIYDGTIESISHIK